MKLLLVLFLGALAGCSTVNTYEAQSEALMYENESGSFYCWREPGPYKPREFVPGSSHDPSEDCKHQEAKHDLAICIASLSKSSSSVPEKSIVKDNLLSCMKDHGWVRYQYMQLTH